MAGDNLSLDNLWLVAGMVYAGESMFNLNAGKSVEWRVGKAVEVALVLREKIAEQLDATGTHQPGNGA